MGRFDDLSVRLWVGARTFMFGDGGGDPTAHKITFGTLRRDKMEVLYKEEDEDTPPRGPCSKARK